jgi:hypothetical protein
MPGQVSARLVVWVEIKKAAARAGVSRATIQRDIEAERLRSRQKAPGCRVCVLEDDLMDLYKLREAS